MEAASVTCAGEFDLPLPASDAIRLFTPEGERGWVDGWEPHYPDPEADPAARGTAFLTHGEGGDVNWLITEAAERRMAYARFDPRGVLALVEVECEPASAGETRVSVTYRMTAVEEGARGELERFAAAYDGYLASWRDAILATL